MFEPPRCPHPDCHHHTVPGERFFVRHGSYQPECREHPVPRFRCRGCRRTFSRQTFRLDYRDRRPECNVRLFESLISGTGLRQSARVLGLGVHSVQRKFRKLARSCRLLHRNIAVALPAGRTYLIDEEETWEKASIRPLTMPVVIEQQSYFVVATMVGPIRRKAAAGSDRRWLQDEEERRIGTRRDRSRLCVRATLRFLRARLAEPDITLRSDQKSSYATLATEIFGSSVTHETTSSLLARGTFNPLFPINHTFAVSRDLCGRLRRKTWLVTERRRCLQLQMHLFVAYRNYVRDARVEVKGITPACHLKLLPRPLTTKEVLTWRQDWGPLSMHPMADEETLAVA